MRPHKSMQKRQRVTVMCVMISLREVLLGLFQIILQFMMPRAKTYNLKNN